MQVNPFFVSSSVSGIEKSGASLAFDIAVPGVNQLRRNMQSRAVLN
jgi:hypothetical protein